MAKKTKEISKNRINDSLLSIQLEDLIKISGRYDLAIISADFPSDLETPVSAFLKLRGDYPCFLLESAEQGERWGRYSILGFGSIAVITLARGKLNLDAGFASPGIHDEPVRSIFNLAQGQRVFACQKVVPFAGGAVGYFGFEVLEHLDKYQLKGARGERSVPDAMFVFPDRFIVFDHFLGKMSLCAVANLLRNREGLAMEYENASMKIEEMLRRLDSHISRDVTEVRKPFAFADASIKGNLSRKDFERMVSRAKRMIYAGEIFQAVLSVRFTTPFKGDAFQVYRSLRRENPSPYMFYLEFPGVTLVGSSPEPMVTKRGNSALIRPIAGTRPRGESAEKDLLLEKDLKSDLKEKAEHVMLVDLARNDLSRVCRSGTVKVTKFMETERYSHVMHLVSQVEGRTRPEVGCYEVFKASFPAGTVSGAPKIRACEIISELEPEPRGPYAGAVGHLSYSGDMDLCIAIRMVVIHDGEAVVQAGAGIVADSQPDREWEEVRNKAKAVLKAVLYAKEQEG